MGATAEEKEKIPIRDIMVALLSIQTKMETTMDTFNRSAVGEKMDDTISRSVGEKMDRAAKKWTPPR